MATRAVQHGDPTKSQAGAMPQQHDWTQPIAMAIPKGGFFKDKVEEGRYGPTFPKTPACYGFSVLAKIIPGREERFYEHAKIMEQAVKDDPQVLDVLKLHYLKWLLFPIKGATVEGWPEDWCTNPAAGRSPFADRKDSNEIDQANIGDH
jgi:hypothetical protein